MYYILTFLLLISVKSISKNHPSVGRTPDSFGERSATANDEEVFGDALNVLSAQNIGDTIQVRELAKKIKANRYWSTYPDSLYYYSTNGLNLANSFHDELGAADMTRFLGIYYWVKGNYAESIEHHLRAKKLYDKLGKLLESAQGLTNLGQVYAALGDNERAVKYYHQSISVVEKLKDPDIATLAGTTNSLGLVYRNFNDYSSAIQMLTKSKDLFSRIGDSLNIAGALTNLGTVAYRKKSYDSAAMYHADALKIFERLKNPKGQVICYNNLANVEQMNGRYDASLRYLEMAYAKSTERGFFESQVSSLIGMGDLKVKQSEFMKAQQFYAEALTISTEKRYRHKLIEIYRGLATCFRELKKFDQSLAYYDKFIQLRDSVYNQENAAVLSNLRVRYDVDQKDAAISLLEKDNKIATLSRNMTFGVASGIVALSALLVFSLMQKIKKDRKLMEQQHELHEAKRAIIQTELDNQKIREDELQKELEFRSRALTTYTLNLVQKNGMLDEVRGIIQDVLKKANDNESELKKLIRLIDYSFTLDKDWDGFKTYFEQVHPDFFKKLKENFPQLSSTELRLCALIRLSLSIKEAASVLSISPDSVKVARHRVRKKIGLASDANLTEFIMAV